ncbi:MAG: family 20 glycosylhydrolase [Gaiellaceae bacterium]
MGGYVSIDDAAGWDPMTQVDGVGEEDIVGVEGCLWSETFETYTDVEAMAFPQLDALAAIASG